MKRTSKKQLEDPLSARSGLGRRDLMKMGVGAGVAAVTQALHAPTALARAQDADQTPPLRETGQKGVAPGGPPFLSPHTPTRRVAKYGWKNESGRAFGNGPMDETSRQIVSYVKSFTVNVTDQMMKDIGVMLLDTIGCGISAFETDPVRIGARVAQLYPGGSLKSTVWGYGVPTTPEMAGFVGCCMVRHHDNNNAGPHETDAVPGILALAEALHSSGPQVLQAMIASWEVLAALETVKFGPGAPGNRGVWGMADNRNVGPMMAMAAGKLMGLNEDQLANALSLSFVGHIAMAVEHWEGPYSMSKGNHDAELIRGAIFSALCARAGMTGPPEPFDGGKGLQDMITGPFKLTIPCRMATDAAGEFVRPLAPGDNRYAIQTLSFKRLPGNGGVPISQVIPAFRNFAKVNEIESIEIQVKQWGDGADPRKWDPLNSETGDHSLAYCFARLMMDGDLFLDSYEMEKMKDPAVRQLMARMTIREVPELKLNRIILRKKTGEEMTREAGEYETPMTLEAVNAKFDRNCAYRGVTNEQRDKIRVTWADLRSVKDIAVPIRETLAHFGTPKPL
jgi:2-methylcitrate dehydratase